jgi:hypothetical protein
MADGLVWCAFHHHSPYQSLWPESMDQQEIAEWDAAHMVTHTLTGKSLSLYGLPCKLSFRLQLQASSQSALAPAGGQQTTCIRHVHSTTCA